MIQSLPHLHRALCEPCGYVGKWKTKRHHAVVALEQHQCSGRHRRMLQQRRIRAAA